jgi:hypothetical protein
MVWPQQPRPRMALLTSSECSAEIGSKAATCPKCGYPGIMASRPDDIPHPGHGGLGMWPIAAMGFTAVVMLTLGATENTKALSGGKLSGNDARERCAEVLRRVSANRSTAKIDPVLPSTTSGDVVTFDWKPSELQLPNRFGALVGESATCSINSASGKVVGFDSSVAR